MRDDRAARRAWGRGSLELRGCPRKGSTDLTAFAGVVLVGRRRRNFQSPIGEKEDAPSLRRGRRVGPLVSRVLLPPERWRSFLLARSYPRALAAYPKARASSPRAPSYMALLRVGFSVPSSLPKTRWALTPPFHPYSVRRRSGLFSVALSSRLILTGGYPALCSTEPGLSSRRRNAERPPLRPDPRPPNMVSGRNPAGLPGVLAYRRRKERG